MYCDQDEEDWAQYDEYDMEEFDMNDIGVHPALKIMMETRYKSNKEAKVGTLIECAFCGKEIKKKSYQSQFCSNKGSGNCKDRFWNRMDRGRLERAVTRLIERGE